MPWFAFIQQPKGLEAVQVLEHDQDLNRFALANDKKYVFLSGYEVDPYCMPAVCCYAKAGDEEEAESLARNQFFQWYEDPDAVLWYEAL